MVSCGRGRGVVEGVERVVVDCGGRREVVEGGERF